jgi:predicted transcriptional regulator
LITHKADYGVELHGSIQPSSNMNPEFPADPKAIKKVETAITKEARADEKDYQRALKELKQSEKSEAKTVKVRPSFGSYEDSVISTLAKAAHGADKNLKKMEQKEYDTVKSLQKATHLHDRAVTNLHTAQSDVQVSSRLFVLSRDEGNVLP